MRQTANHDKVVDKLNQLLSITDVLTTDKKTILRALNSPFKDFEDAIQSFSAEVIGDIDVIVTRNTKDFKNSALGVMTPEDYLKTFFEDFS